MWRQRLDQSTTWAVTVIAPILTWAFSTGDNLHYILLVGVGAVTIFFVAVLGVTLWPREWHPKGEFREGDPEAWKEDENEDD